MRALRTSEITSGSIPRVIFALALPLMGGMFLETAFNFVNGIWVGRIGAEALAAINMSGFLIWMFYSLMGIVNTGTTSVVARYVGAGREDEARSAARQGIFCCVILCLLLTAGAWSAGRAVILAMGAAPLVADLAEKYLLLIFAFSLPFGLIEVLGAILRGYGNTRTPTFIWTLGFCLNMILDPFLILGVGPFPRMGVVGAAVATDISFCASFALFLFLLLRGRLEFRLTSAGFSPEWSKIRTILAIGFPPSISGVVFCAVYMVLTRIINLFGTEAVAALGVGHRVESLSFTFCFAFGMATITMVGQNLGAGKAKRAEESAWTAAAIVGGIAGGFGLLFYFFSGSLARIFIDDPGVIGHAADYLRIIAASQIFMGASIVLEDAFAGAGDTLPPMMISIPFVLLRIPLSYLLAVRLGWGLAGVWWAITFLSIARGSAVALWFRCGDWKRKSLAQVLF